MWTRLLSSRHAWRALVIACALASLSATARTEEPSDAAQVHHAVWRARNHLVVDGRPTPLFWAVGLSDPSDLGAYASLGLNAVEIVIARPSAETWEAAEGIAGAATARGMYVLVTLTPPKELTRGPVRGFRVSPLDAAYREAVRAYLRPVVERGGELPGLVAWVVEGVDADSLPYSAADFAEYLLRWHGGLAAVRRAWGTAIGDAAGITESFVAELDSRKPLGVGRASLDLARYRSEVYRELLDVWAQEIRRLDSKHVVLAGRQRSYRAAISVPATCDGMLLGLYPDVAEDDLATHNVHGVDVARRGNQFAALPVLKLSAARSGAQAASWIAQAVLHGAAGIGFAHWRDIRANEALRRDVRAALLVTHELRLCPRVPAATAAFLYEPWAAGGFAGGRPLYGWLTGASVSEPGALFRALGRGTAFGQVDYLSESSLADVRLDRYGAIVAPLALSLGSFAQAALVGYVSRGGTLLADLGVGFDDTASVTRLPRQLGELFGVRSVPGELQGPVSFIAMTQHPRFPSLRRELGTASAANPAKFDPPISYVGLWAGAAPVLAEWSSAPAFAGIMARPYGKGWAAYGTTRLWQDWPPGNPAFDAFHRDLFGFSSPIALAQAGGVVSEDDVALFEDGSILLLKQRGEPSEVLVRNPRGTIFRISGGVQQIRAVGTSANSALVFGGRGLQLAEPLPIETTTEAERLLVQVAAYSEEIISLVFYGPATRIAPRDGGSLGVVAGGDATARVRIRSGEYKLEPGSRHEIRVQQLREERSSLGELTVRGSGTLAFDTPANSVVTIKPVGEGEPEPSTPGG